MSAKSPQNPSPVCHHCDAMIRDVEPRYHDPATDRYVCEACIVGIADHYSFNGIFSPTKSWVENGH